MVVGLTGGVASGKSLVAHYLKELGAKLIDADEISREIVRPGMPAYQEILQVFGKGILNQDGTIDRKGLGKVVFSNPELLKRLNEITHPGILEEVRRRVGEAKKDQAIIVVDAALLIEVGLHREMDRVIVVYVDEETQIKRLMERDGLTEGEAKLRLSAQMPLKEKLKDAHFIIDNSIGMEETRRQVEEVFKELKRC